MNTLLLKKECAYLFLYIRNCNGYYLLIIIIENKIKYPIQFENILYIYVL